jgi:hypothetical protein
MNTGDNRLDCKAACLPASLRIMVYISTVYMNADTISQNRSQLPPSPHPVTKSNQQINAWSKEADSSSAGKDILGLS